MAKKQGLDRFARIFAADFETAIDDTGAYVYSWAALDYKKEGDKYSQYDFGNCIEDFHVWLSKQGGNCVYFHNAKFDCSYIIDHLLTVGYKWVEHLSEEDCTFETLMTADRQFYRMRVFFAESGIVEIRDSYKIIHCSLDNMARDFKMPFGGKHDYDYSKLRPRGYKIDASEKAYLAQDVRILATGLKYAFSNNITELTIASSALKFAKSTIGDDIWDLHFPQLSPDIDKFARMAYYGALTGGRYGIDFYNVWHYDVHSDYPDKLHNSILPYGEPVIDNKLWQNEEYPLYIAKIEVQCTLKSERYPCLLYRGGRFTNGRQLVNTYGVEERYSTNVDIELMYLNYDVTYFKVLEVHHYRGKIGLLAKYVDICFSRKQQGEREQNWGMYICSKYLLNALTGKFGAAPESELLSPVLTDGKIKWISLGMEETPIVYVPLVAFITAYGRKQWIETVNTIPFTSFCNGDTDSVFTLVPLPPDIVGNDLGYWGLEKDCREAPILHMRVLKQKCYMIEYLKDGQIVYDLKVTGLTEKNKFKDNGLPVFDWDGFHVGGYGGLQLKQKTLRGGCTLVETPFTIKQSNSLNWQTLVE